MSSNSIHRFDEISVTEDDYDSTQPGLGGASSLDFHPNAFFGSDITSVSFDTGQLPNETPIPPNEYGTCSHTSSSIPFGGNLSSGFIPGQLGFGTAYTSSSEQRTEEEMEPEKVDLSLTRHQRQELEKQARAKISELPDIKFNGIGFSLYDREIEKLGIEITEERHPDDRNTVNDPRLGTISGTKACRTCTNTAEQCNGHLGWIRLNRYYSPKTFKKWVVKVLNCICITCKRLRVTMDDMKRDNLWRYRNNDPNDAIIWNYHNEERLKRIERLVLSRKNISCPRNRPSNRIDNELLETASGDDACRTCMNSPKYKYAKGRIHYIIKQNGNDRIIPLELEQIRYILEQIPTWEYLITKRLPDGTLINRTIPKLDYDEIEDARSREFLTVNEIEPGSYMITERTINGIQTSVLTPQEYEMSTRRFISAPQPVSNGLYTATEMTINGNLDVQLTESEYLIYTEVARRHIIGSPTLLSEGGYLVTEEVSDDIDDICVNRATSSTSSVKSSVLTNSNYNRIRTLQEIDIVDKREIPSDSQIMGFEPPAHPKKLIMRYLVVPPLRVRPPTTRDGREMPDDITQMLSAIVRQNKAIDQPLKLDIDNMGPCDLFPSIIQPRETEKSKRSRVKDDPAQKLANQIHALFFGNPSNTTRREFVSIRKLIQGKHGIIRKFMMGKRGDYGARTVLSPGPEYEYGEIGIPRLWSSVLTMPEMVTNENMSVMKTLIREGRVSQIRFGGDRERFISIKPGEIPDYRLKIGDIIERHLQDGDYVAFNRNPSLHKYSIMGYRVKLHDDMTIRLGIGTTPHHNADFDGDEGNIFLPRTLEAVAELQTVMNSRYCIQSGQDNKPLTGLIFNDLTAVYKLTRTRPEETMINEYTWRDCMKILNRDERTIPPVQLNTLYDRLTQHKIHVRSGRALFSALLPADFYYSSGSGSGNVQIVDGVLVSTNGINKSTAGVAHRSILQFLLKNYDAERAALFLSDAQFILKRWLRDDPVTTSLSDCYPKDDPTREVLPLYEIFNNELYDIYTEESQLNEFTDICVTTIEQNTDYSTFNTISARLEELNEELGDFPIELTTPQYLISSVLPTDYNFFFQDITYIKNGLFIEQIGDYDEIANFRYQIDRLEKLQESKGTEEHKILIQDYRDAIESHRNEARELRKALISDMFNKYGGDRTMDFIRDLNMILERCMGVSRFGGKHYEMIRRENEKAKAILEKYGPELNDPTKREKARNFIIAQLDNVTRIGDETMNENLGERNNFSLIVNKAKTKGGGANIGQISAFLGPQFKGGDLIAKPGDNIYQAFGDLDPENFGFVKGSFVRGIDPLGFFFHAMASREGMVDTSINTAGPGELTRQLVKTFEDVQVTHDGTVRLIDGPIIQSMYGCTDLNPEKLINVNFPDGTLPFFIDVDSVIGKLNSQYYSSVTTNI